MTAGVGRGQSRKRGQGKGKLAERQGIGMEQAFGALRGCARSHSRRLSDVVRAFIADSERLAGPGL
ncbi:ANTAR domain-containing protein [Streptomyces griseorubiginosus]|uniref:ANTAR domain-containing protein n=1 Tax=Streptomyces griseorubiginosus TaxID=67304 RepID=UPI00340B2333